MKKLSEEVAWIVSCNEGEMVVYEEPTEDALSWWDEGGCGPHTVLRIRRTITIEEDVA